MPAYAITTARVCARFSLLLALCSLLPATGAWAEIVPLMNKSISRSLASADGNTDNVVYTAGPGEFEFYGLALSQVGGDVGSSSWAAGTFDLYVSMGTECIQVVARSDGAAFGSGYTRGEGHPGMLFTVNETQEYIAVVQLFQRDLTGPNHWMWLTDVAHHTYWMEDTYGITQPIGRIAPGSYWIEGAIDYSQTTDTGQGPELQFTMCFFPCTPVVTQQPSDVVASPGSTINVQLTASSAQPPVEAMGAQVANTYQWRKDLVNLTNGGRVSGVTTDHLVITNATYDDYGLYDCVVTQGSIVEPSRQSKVTVHQTTDVEPALASELQFAVPRPNPFGAKTTLQFQLARETEVSLAIFDAQGRRVRMLLPTGTMAPGSHSIEWDGRDEAGARAASGVYFAQLTAGSSRVVQRAVLMTGE